MTRGISSESQVLLRLLDDGQWHPYEPTFVRLLSAVAPGKALRRYEQIEAARIRNHGPRKGPELTEDERIAFGRRSVANDTVNSMKKRHIELTYSPTGRMLRRRPIPLPVSDPYRVPPPRERDRDHAGLGLPCDICSGPCRIDDPAPDAPPAHPGPKPAADASWVVMDSAAGSESVPVVAFFSESQVRQILHEVVKDVVHTVVDAAFDRFQRGMRGFLLGRFAEVERLLYRGAGPPERGHPRDRAGIPRRNR